MTRACNRAILFILNRLDRIKIKIDELPSSRGKVPMTSTLEEETFTPALCVMGVFGQVRCTEEEIQEKICMPLLQELGTMPTKLLLPSEGASSLYLQEWAESLHIATHVFQCNWGQHGKMAQILRDDRIQKECTHALVFLSDKSEKPEQLRKKLMKKGKKVWTYSITSVPPLQTYLQTPPPSLPASTPARKSGTGTVQTLLKFQTKAGY